MAARRFKRALAKTFRPVAINPTEPQRTRNIPHATHLLTGDMPKRKRDDTASSEDNPDRSAARALRLQRLQLEGLLSNGTKTLFRALKVARGFERQKLGRRQKDAQQSKDEEETKRLEMEVATLKVRLFGIPTLAMS